MWHPPRRRRHRLLTPHRPWQLRSLLQQQEKQRGTVRRPCPAPANAAAPPRSRSPAARSGPPEREERSSPRRAARVPTRVLRRRAAVGTRPLTPLPLGPPGDGTRPRPSWLCSDSVVLLPRMVS